MEKGVYAGSFDPVTKGHEWMIKKGTKLFDQFIVAVGVNPDKKYTFSPEERMKMLKEITKKYKNIEVHTFENQFLVKYAKSIGAKYILRGIRSGGDYEYERGMRHVNRDLAPGITTLFLMPPREIAEVSSSLVKGLVGYKDWKIAVKKYVPLPVFKKFLEKFKK